ncbi:hypothetical protein [Paenibacillus radicibacter]|uniref:hypothetical protein n=1 Tax=Paenibacillus radicibacter TaxID=2972488 RepID=UPI0021594F32|nr:hypothetical protein [Paenibacillus radicibacter]
MQDKSNRTSKTGKSKPPSPISRLKPFLLKRKAALVGSIATGVVAVLMGLIPY